MRTNEEKIHKLVKHADGIDMEMERVVINSKTDFMSAFGGKYDVRKRNTIHKCFGDMVHMWQKGYTDGVACSYAGLNLNTFNKYLQQYDAWAARKFDNYDKKENPMRIIKKAVRSLEQDKKLLPAEEKATPSELLRINEYRQKREVEIQKEPPKKKKRNRRTRIEMNVDNLKVSVRDANEMNRVYQPIALKSGKMTDTAKALHEQSEGEY